MGLTIPSLTFTVPSGPPRSSSPGSCDRHAKISRYPVPGKVQRIAPLGSYILTIQIHIL